MGRTKCLEIHVGAYTIWWYLYNSTARTQRAHDLLCHSVHAALAILLCMGSGSGSGWVGLDPARKEAVGKKSRAQKGEKK